MNQTREPDPMVINMAHQACLLMPKVDSILSDVIKSLQETPATRSLTAPAWSMEGLEGAVHAVDHLMQGLTDEDFYFYATACGKLMQAHAALTASCFRLLELLLTRLEAMTQACKASRASSSLQARFYESTEVLRVVCWCADAWYLPACHLASSTFLFAAVNRVLLWALVHTRQQQQQQQDLYSLSPQTDVAITRFGMLNVRVFQHIAPSCLLRAVCKLPTTLIPALACFLCERMWSGEARNRLADAVLHSESIVDWIVPYLDSQRTAPEKAAMSRVLLCRPLLAWARMDFEIMMPEPSPSPAVRRQERASPLWPPSSSDGERAWEYLSTLEALGGSRMFPLAGGGEITGNASDLVTNSAVNNLCYLRALRIIARNLPQGSPGSEARCRERITLGQQQEALAVWLGSRLIMGTVTTSKSVEMALPLAAFLSNTVLHWLRYQDAKGSGMQRELGDVQTMMKEMGQLIQNHQDAFRDNQITERLSTWRQLPGAAVVLEAILRGAPGAANPDCSAMSLNRTCLVAGAAMQAILAMVTVPASATTCYCLALTINKLLEKHNLRTHLPADDSNSSGGRISSTAQTRMTEDEGVDPRILDTFFETCVAIYTQLQAHTAHKTVELGRKRPAVASSPDQVGHLARVKAKKVSTLWLLYRICSHLFATLSSFHTRCLLSIDSKPLPTSTNARSAMERKARLKDELQSLQNTWEQQGEQFTALTEFSMLADLKPSLHSSSLSVSWRLCGQQLHQIKELSIMDASWHRHSIAVLKHGVMPGCSYSQCGNTCGFSEAVLPTMLCSGCKRVRYCSVACQQAAWVGDGHRDVCRN